MPKIVPKVELNQNELRAWELSNHPHNLTLKEVAKKMGKATSSISNYLRGYRLKAKPEEIDNTLIERKKRLREKAWLRLEESLDATKLVGVLNTEHPDFPVRYKASIDILNSEGELIFKDDSELPKNAGTGSHYYNTIINQFTSEQEQQISTNLGSVFNRLAKKPSV